MTKLRSHPKGYTTDKKEQSRRSLKAKYGRECECDYPYPHMDAGREWHEYGCPVVYFDD